MSDYRSAYKNFIDALLLCEKYKIISEESKIHNNLGNIYYHFRKYDIAKSYYNKALIMGEDTANIPVYYNNLGMVMLEVDKIDSAFYYFNRSLQICKKYNYHLSVVSNSVASLYQKIKQYDSAYYYYKLSVEESRKNNLVQHEIKSLSDLGELFFEINEIDSALFYTDLSNTLAAQNSFSRVIADNYLILSKIEESKGNTGSAFKYYKKYADLKDSVFNTAIFGDISQLQRSYEVSKTNQQIEHLIVKQQIRERTIFIILCILLLVSVVLFYIYRQKKNLNKAYKALVEKNLEIISLQENSSQKYQKKIRATRAPGNASGSVSGNTSGSASGNVSSNAQNSVQGSSQNELFDKILAVMEDCSIICDTGFTIDKLATIVQANHAYVSQVINNISNKNFRSFLNAYRIQEAQRVFSEPDAGKYTIESVALRVGFKSRSVFYDAFKEVTGVSPNFYFKSVQKQ
jgi:AraC-like DNA-binding protein